MDDGLNDIVPDERPVLLMHREGNGRTREGGGELPDNIRSMDDGLNDVVPDERPVLLVHGEGNRRTGRVRLTLLPRLAHLPDILAIQIKRNYRCKNMTERN
jgi:hypothetical protein